MEKGILYGVSTGPGDPELMTVKAINTIKKVPVIAAPRTKMKNCMALDTVKGIMDVSDKEIIYLDFAMKSDEKTLQDTHKVIADQIAEKLAGGKDVAMLNIGDASLFGTYCYIRDRLQKYGYEAKTVPGVNSFSAVAAALEKSLTTMTEPLMIVPGSYDDIEGVLDIPGSKILMKSGKALAEVKEIIEKAGLSEKASLVANCSMENERVYQDIRDSEDNEGYFATILVEA